MLKKMLCLFKTNTSHTYIRSHKVLYIVVNKLKKMQTGLPNAQTFFKFLCTVNFVYNEARGTIVPNSL